MESKSGFYISPAHWLETATKLVAVAGSFSLICSITYDWAYFKALDLSFSDIPSSISDHLRTSLIWFPIILILFGGGAIIELITQRFEKGMSEEEIIQSSQEPEKIRKMRAMPYKFARYIAGLILIMYVLLGDFVIRGVPPALLLLWVNLAIWLNNHPRIQKRRDPLLQLVIIFIPTVLIFLGSQGYVEGKKVILKNEPLYRISLKQTNQENISVVVVRFFEKGALLKHVKNNEFFFLKWEEIVEFNTRKDDLIYHGLLSNWFDISKAEKVIYKNVTEEVLKDK